MYKAGLVGCRTNRRAVRQDTWTSSSCKRIRFARENRFVFSSPAWFTSLAGSRSSFIAHSVLEDVEANSCGGDDQHQYDDTEARIDQGSLSERLKAWSCFVKD